MPIVKLSMLADTVLIDQATSTVSVISILEAINSLAFPILLTKLTAFFLIEKEADEQDTYEGAVVFSSGENEIQRYPVSLNFQGKSRLRQVLAFNNYLVKEPGTLKVTMLIEGEQRSSYEVPISIIGKPEVSAS